jgi:hypothetical protein
MGVAVHLGDVQPKLLASVRTLVLGVLSWLLLVIVVVGTIFAVSLLFTGLKPLWDTKAATVTLLSFCVALVLLINAAYQQGDAERLVNIVMKWAARGACLLLLVFSVIAAISLKLRIDQYGLSADRVMALIAVIIALAYGLAYAVCALWPKGRWLARIEPVNIGLAIFKCLLFIAVLTPIADPRRLGVDDQVFRLIHHRVAPEHFDWAMLRYDGGTYGMASLEALTLNPTYATKAKEVLGWKNEDLFNHRLNGGTNKPQMRKIDPQSYTIIAPEGAILPESFVRQDFGSDHSRRPPCLAPAPASAQKDHCEVILIDLNDDRGPEMLILNNHFLTVAAYDNKAGWHMIAQNRYLKDGEVANFKTAKVAGAKPLWDDVMIGASRFPVEEP